MQWDKVCNKFFKEALKINMYSLTKMSGTKLFRTPDPSTVDSASTSFLSTLSMSPLILHRDTFNHNHFYHERSGSLCERSVCTVHHALNYYFFSMVQNIQQGRLSGKILFGTGSEFSGPIVNMALEKRAISRRQSVKNFKRMENVIGSIYQAITSSRRN